MKHSGESMSKVDTAWLRMDSASNLMAILGVWTLKPGVRHADLCRRVEERLLKYDRFRQRVHEDSSGARWVDHAVDVRQHVVREKLPRRADPQAALRDRIGELAMMPLDRARPLWQMHLVEDYEGGSALIVRIHHCLADGIALILVTLSLVDGGKPPLPRRRRAEAEDGEGWLGQTLVGPLMGLASKALDAAGEGAAKSLGMLLDPKHGAKASRQVAQLGYQVVSDALSLLLMPDDSPTRLKGKPGTQKRVAWCPPLPLDEVKEVGKALGCSINDVLLACVAGAVGQYLREQGDTWQAWKSAPWCPSTCARPNRPGSWATISGWRPWCCPWASPTRWNASTRCAAAWPRSRTAPSRCSPSRCWRSRGCW